MGEYHSRVSRCRWLSNENHLGTGTTTRPDPTVPSLGVERKGPTPVFPYTHIKDGGHLTPGTSPVLTDSTKDDLWVVDLVLDRVYLRTL